MATNDSAASSSGLAFPRAPAAVCDRVEEKPVDKMNATAPAYALPSAPSPSRHSTTVNGEVVYNPTLFYGEKTFEHMQQQEREALPSAAPIVFGVPDTWAMMYNGGAADPLLQEAAGAMELVATETQHQYLAAVDERAALHAQVIAAEAKIAEVQALINKYVRVENPVTASDGFTYEESNVRAFLEECAAEGEPPVSQQTQEPLTQHLVPNRSLSKLVQQISTIHPQPVPPLSAAGAPNDQFGMMPMVDTSFAPIEAAALLGTATSNAPAAPMPSAFVNFPSSTATLLAPPPQQQDSKQPRRAMDSAAAAAAAAVATAPALVASPAEMSWANDSEASPKKAAASSWAARASLAAAKTPGTSHVQRVTAEKPEDSGESAGRKTAAGEIDSAALHPCLRVYGSCSYGAQCTYALLPHAACLNFVKRKCKLGAACKEPHVDMADYQNGSKGKGAKKVGGKAADSPPKKEQAQGDSPKKASPPVRGAAPTATHAPVAPAWGMKSEAVRAK
jgi:hypothetical protein